MPVLLRVLVIDDPDQSVGQLVYLLTHILHEAGFDPQLQIVKTAREYLLQLQDKPDLILFPAQHPGLDVYHARNILREAGLDIPLIVIGGSIGEEAVATCMQRGAADYVHVDRLARLGEAVQRLYRHNPFAPASQVEAERFEWLLEESQVVFYDYRIRPEPGLSYINSAIAPLTGYTPQDFYAEPQLAQQIINPDDLTILTTMLNKPTDAPQTVLLRWQRRDGGIVYAEHHFLPVWDDAGNLIAVQGVARDVTERERVEEVMTRQTEYLAALHETTLSLLNHRDINDLLKAIMTHTEGLMGTLHGAIYLAEPGDDRLILRIANGFFDQFVGHETTMHDNEGIAAVAIKTGRPSAINDYATWSGRSTLPGLDTLQAAASVPLTSGGRVVGVLSLAHTEAGRIFGDHELDLLNRFGALASLALDNAWLYTEAQRELAERRRVEQALKDNEERLKLVLQGSNDGFWDWNLVTGHIQVSERWAEMLGYEPDEIDPTIAGWEALLHPDDRPTTVRALHEHLEGRSPYYEVEARLLTKSGAWKWVLDRGKVAARDDQGRPQRMAGTHSDISRRKAAEDALNQSENKFRSYVQQSPEGIVLTDEQGRIIEWNRGQEILTGLTREETLGRFIWDVQIELGSRRAQQETYFEGLKATTLKLLDGGEAPWKNKSLENELCRPDGSTRFVQYMAFSICTDKGVMLASSSRDVTERKWAEDALRVSEERNRAILNAIPDLMFRLDPQGKFVDYWANNVGDLYVPPSAFVGRIVTDVLPPALGQLILHYVQQTLDTQQLQVFEYAMMTEGESRYYECRMVVSGSDEVLAVIRNITQRKQAEVQLVEKEQRLEMVLEGSGYGLWDWNLATGETAFSNNLIEMLGYPGETLDNHIDTIQSLIHPDDLPRVQNVLNEHSEGRAPHFEAEVRARMASGAWKWMQMRGKVMLRDQSDKPLRMVGIFSDITERKRHEETLREALQREKELSEMRARFVSMVSHEFRTPLATILATADSLRRYLPRMNEMQKTERFAKIETQVRHMTALLEEVLLIGKMEANALEYQPDWVDVDGLFRETVADLQQSCKTHRLVYTGPDHRRPILADRKLLRQIATNLLSNAIKYSLEDSVIQFALALEDQRATFYVRDSGIGIPAEDQPNLFMPFRRGTNVGAISGTGLGLSIVKHAVDLHGGAISVQSAVGTGTTFTVTLPNRQTQGQS